MRCPTCKQRAWVDPIPHVEDISRDPWNERLVQVYDLSCGHSIEYPTKEDTR